MSKIFINSRWTIRKTAVIIAVEMSLIEDSIQSEIRNIFDASHEGRLTSNPVTEEKPSNVVMLNYNPSFNGPLLAVKVITRSPVHMENPDALSNLGALLSTLIVYYRTPYKRHA